MSSVHLLRKTMFLPSSRISFRLCLKIHKYSTQNVCSIADFKSLESQTGFRNASSEADSDNFGTLKKPLETNLRFKHNSRTTSTAVEKKIIKIKRPPSNECDVFGNLSENKPMWYPDMNEESKYDNDLSDDSVIVKNFGKRFRNPERYLHEMKELVKQKKIKDALDLFVDMKRNFVSPIHGHYTYMIGVCGRIGYTEMAFKLLKQMTEKCFQPTPATLTGLFNSCAESPFPEYGLKKARLLKEKIEMKNWAMTQITYNAMIKAFGKCGDMMTAFKIVDEMAKSDIKINAGTYNFLLMSCIANKEAGFTYAVEVWRKMKAKKCRPNVFTFNLLLRAARDCDVGPKEISSLLLQHWSSYSKRPYGFITKEELSKKPNMELNSGLNNTISKPLENTENEDHSALETDHTKIIEFFDGENASKCELQNATNASTGVQNSYSPGVSVLTARPINGPEILEIGSIKTPSDRLSLIGGLEKFLEFMSNSKVKPDIKTFTLLLDCLPASTQEEDKLLTIIDKYEMKPDIDFFNVLIKRRNFRKEIKAARDVLLLINKYELIPDIMTFGALALGCRNLDMASIFISEMKKLGSSPNIEILGCMMRQACIILDFSYMKYVLNLMEEQEIKPNNRIISTIEKTLSDTRKSIILMEHGKEVNSFYQRKDHLQADFKEFFNFYEEWLKRMKFQLEEDPWSQFRTDIVDRYKEEQMVQ